MARHPVIALLGGGQLGRMFIENALRYNVPVHVLDPDPDAPCARIAARFVQGRFDDPATVLRFAADADVVGIEIEHVSVEALEELERQGKRVLPAPQVLRTIQDKGLQKAFYARHGIPSAPYALIASRDELAAHRHLLPGFLKARTGGYDGRGVMPVDATTDPADLFDGPAVLEQRVELAMELAVLVVRTDDGRQVAYDPVEMAADPRYHLLDHQRAPARTSAAVAALARERAEQVAAAFGAPGLYAVELFLTPDGEVLVNETAPRPHNSGHHTIEACASSQFDQLLRLYMGWPPGDAATRGPSAMINLVGEGGEGEPHLHGAHQVLSVPGAFVHLYGKARTRTGRKMGHVTVIAHDQAELDRAIDATRAHCKVVPLPPNTTDQ
ncbi:MAG: 5-(carboxyamino)imidazole ribonucleotide synthase [Flavobacteriales bacterium]|nr:5-(carboxyamino)imidazole ribonucleotide synthase [Flavobacteriales bacterium]